MMNRIPVPKSVYEALDDALTAGYSNLQIVLNTKDRSWYNANYQALNNCDPNDIMRALIIGYELEPTPEDRIKDLYNTLKQASHLTTIAEAYRAGIKAALVAHGIYYDWLNKGDKTKK